MRNLKFTGPGPVNRSLEVRAGKREEVDRLVETMIEEGRGLREIIDHVNRYCGLNDAEWTGFVWGLAALAERSHLAHLGYLTRDQADAAPHCYNNHYDEVVAAAT